MCGKESESDETNSQGNTDTTLDKMMAFDNTWMDVLSLIEELNILIVHTKKIAKKIIKQLFVYR